MNLSITGQNKDIYKKLLNIAIPMMIQNGISNIVNLLDNFMIGSVGTVSLSGVGIANQMMFVFFLMTFYFFSPFFNDITDVGCVYFVVPEYLQFYCKPARLRKGSLPCSSCRSMPYLPKGG